MDLELQPKPVSYRFKEFLMFIENGTIKLPKFQREFVWDVKETAKLLDSILKGYPIGSIIIWKTHDRLNNIKDIGSIKLPETPSGEPTKYVLDGQQRLASIFVSFRGETIKNKDNKNVDYKKICINLDIDDRSEQLITTNDDSDFTYISIYELLNNYLDDLHDKYDKKYFKKIAKYQKQFEGYDFSVIELINYPMVTAVDVFTRLNTTGKDLTLFDIMVAQTYDESKQFDLYEKYNELSKELEPSNYEIPSVTILQCISLNLNDDCTRKTILNLKNDQIVDSWELVIRSIKKSIEFFISELDILVSQLLPYSTLIIPFSYFFYRNDEISNIQTKLLKEYFWRASLSYRFSNAVESKLAQDAKRILEILNERRPNYDNKFHIQLSPEIIQNHPFSTSDSFCKAILCLYCSYSPKLFNNNRKVKLDNNWLLKSNSKNYHHFFPKAYLKNEGYAVSQQNVISNITIIDDNLNKKKIGKRSPSDYMTEFKEKNSLINDTMKTHLIDNLDQYGIWSDSYSTFIKMRSKKIYDVLKNKIED